MSHGKTFRNKTGSDLTLRLTVRSGSTPLTEPAYGTADGTVAAGGETRIAYGDDANPYLDSIEGWVVLSDGEHHPTYVTEPERGGECDSNMNTHDTVTVSVLDGHVHFEFSNG